MIPPRYRLGSVRAHAPAGMVVIASLVASLALISLYWCRFNGDVPAFWPANAVPLALLIVRRPVRIDRAAYMIAAAWLGNLAACLIAQVPPAQSVLIPLANAAEIACASAAAWSPIGPRPRIRRLDGLVKFIVSVGLIGPAVSAAMIDAATDLGFAGAVPSTWTIWFAAHALGNILFTTAGAALLNRPGRSWLPVHRRLRAGLAFAICFVLSAITFHQPDLPMLFVMPLLFAFLGMVTGLEFTCVAITGLALYALFRTALGYGPIAAIDHASITSRILLLQAFVTASFLAAIPIALVSERHTLRIAQLNRQKSALLSRASRYRDLAEVAADTILVTLQDGTILYASPAAERLIGVPGSALIGRSAFDLMAPEDQPDIRAALATLSNETREITAELRLRHSANATPVWTEIKTRMGTPQPDRQPELVSVVRDISERRAAEELRNADLKRLDHLANTDSLTGLANHRRFTTHLDTEWRRAFRDHTNIALVLIDVDLFKSYNDLYGHPAGDRALQRIATIVGASALRVADLACRIGGEEFAVILPMTFLSGARSVAERIRDGIRDAGIVHERSQTGILSVSIGIDCSHPEQDSRAETLVERADKALYQAKRQRGSIVIAT